MKRYTFLAALLLATGAWAQTQAAMNDQAKKAFLSADKTLSATLSTVKENLTEEQRIKVDKAQATWQAYRDACAESEASQYTGGSIWPMVYYTSLEELTKARTTRLKNMLPEGVVVAEPEPEPMPEEDPPPPPPNPVANAMAKEAVSDAIDAVKNNLVGEYTVAEYLKEVLPTPADLPAALRAQGVDGDLDKWVTAEPERAYDVLTVAAYNELKAQRKSGKDGFGDPALVGVVGYLRDVRKNDGLTSGAVGAIGAELVVKPLGAYRLQEWMKSEGYAKLMKDYVNNAMNP